MEHFLIDGREVAVEVVGSGPPLVLLHGILVDSRAWRHQLDGLRHQFTVVAWDLPGCGRSADPPPTWRFPEYADCLAELMSTMGLASPIVCGFSWGGALAIAIQDRHPSAASALILVGAYAGWAGSLPREVVDERLASCVAQSTLAGPDVASAWLPGLFTPAAPAQLVDEYTRLISEFHPSGFLTMAHAVAEADLRAALPTIDVPVLVLHGEDDRRAPAGSVGADLAARLPRARLQLIAGAGHLCHAERSEAFNAAVREFAHGLRDR